MHTPAVSYSRKTAGRKTKQHKKWRQFLCVGVAAAISFTALGQPMQIQASNKQSWAQLLEKEIQAQSRMLANAPLFQKQTKSIVVTEKIPFDTTYIDMPNVYKGYFERLSLGTTGERRVEAQVVYQGRKATSIVSLKSTELGKPVSEVVKRGTKVLHSETFDGSSWKTSFAHPLDVGWLSADFYDYPHHNGIDIAAAYGTPVKAAASGVVTLSNWYGEYGYCVIVSHSDGSQTLYAHNSSLKVRVGERVKQGQQIANVGSTGNSTGNHLHFEIRSGSQFLDPLVYINK